MLADEPGNPAIQQSSNQQPIRRTATEYYLSIYTRILLPIIECYNSILIIHSQTIKLIFSPNVPNVTRKVKEM